MRAALGLALLLLLVQRDSDEAARRYAAGDFAAAARIYAERLEADPASPAARYNLGTTLLAMKRFDAARDPLHLAARSGREGLRPAAYHNLGNTDLEPAFADGTGAARPDARRERLVRAIAAYKRALLLDPAAEDARWNLELARRLLEETPPVPRENPQGGGGAGGGGGGGGGGSDESRPGGEDEPRPNPAEGGGAQPALTEAQAERLLAAAEMRETGVQREKLRKQQPRSTAAH